MSIGRHEVEEPEPGLTLVRCHGDLSPEEARGFLELLLPGAATVRLVFDISALGLVPAETRRLLGQIAPCRAHPLAIVGGSFRTRLVVTSLLAARQQLEHAVFFDRLEDAVAWARGLDDNSG